LQLPADLTAFAEQEDFHVELSLLDTLRAAMPCKYVPDVFVMSSYPCPAPCGRRCRANMFLTYLSYQPIPARHASG